MYTAEVKIGLKKGVADPEGANTLKTLKLLGFDNIVECHTVKSFTLTIDAPSEDEARAVVDNACKRLLANPVIHNAEIKLAPLATA